MKENSDQKENEISIGGYTMSITDQLAQKMISAAIKELKSPTPDADQIARWKTVIEKRIRIPNINDIDKANPGQIRRALQGIWCNYEDLASVLFEIWMTYNQPLISECTESLNGHNLYEIRQFVRDMEKAKQDEPNKEPVILGEMVRTIFRKISGPYSEEEIRLGILASININVEYKKIVEEEEEELKQSGVSSRQSRQAPSQWEAILDELRQIPADDPAWNSMDKFIQAATEIASQKLSERITHEEKQKLSDALNRYGEDIKRRAAYLEISGVEEWTVDRVPTDQIEDACTSIQSLDELLQEFSRLDSLPYPSVRSERLKFEDDRRKAEERLIEGYRAAQRFFQIRGEMVETKLPSTPESLVDTPENLAVDDEGTIYPETGQESAPSNISDLPETTSERCIEGAKEPVELVTLQTEVFVHPVAIEPPVEITGGLSGSVDQTRDSSLATTLEGQDSRHVEDQGAGEVQVILPQIPAPEIKPATLLSHSNTNLASCIEARDLSVAYWLAWAMEQQGEESLIPSWLIAAVQSCIWSISLWPEQSPDLHESLCNLVSPEQKPSQPENDATAWLRFICGMYFTLVIPRQGWAKWVQVPGSHNIPQLNQLTELVLDYYTKGLRLDPELVQMIINKEETDQLVDDLARQAKQWLSQAPSRTTRNHRAKNLWQELLRVGQGELYLLIEPVASNRRSAAKQVQTQLANWTDRPWLERMVQRLDQELRLRNEFSIIGEAKQQIINWILDVCTIADRWSSIIIHQDELINGDSWSYSQTRELCYASRQILRGVNPELIESQKNAFQPGIHAVLGIVAWVFEGLEAILGENTRAASATWLKPNFPDVPFDRSSHTFIRRCLAQPLIFQPELNLDNNGVPGDEQASQVLSILEKGPNHSAVEAIQGWLDRRDYRFIDQLLEDIPDRDVWVERCREAFHSDLQWIENNSIYETDVDVEQSKIENLISDQEYIEYKNRIESVQKNWRQADWETNRRISFDLLVKRLQGIRDQIGKRRQAKIDHLKERWKNIRYDVLPLLGDDHDLSEKIANAIEGSLASNDPRSVNAYIEQLQDAISKGKKPAQSLFEVKTAEEIDILKQFHNLLPAYVDLFEPFGRKMTLQGIADMIKRDEPLPGMPHVSPSSSRRIEAHRAIEAWQLLKRSGPEYDPRQNENIKTILSYLGFILRTESPVTVGRSGNIMPNFLHWHVKMNAPDSAPVAMFGSERNGEYEVIGVWQRPGIEAITSQVNALMQQTANQPAILFYFHYLTSTRRDQLLSAAHRESLPMLVIDEPLILYLARINDTRLKPMFYCTLPYALVDPYYPFVRGKVPSEAFKGRGDYVQQLMDPAGPVIVYGGRQLGKSALLHQVELSFHQPDDNRFAIYRDIKSVGDPASGINYQRDLCDQLAKELTGTSPKLIEDRRSYDIDRLVSQLQENIISKNRRIILLLDEADHFLDADAEKNFYVVHKLKDLMDKTNRRFKIVLAGLHNVQRFQRMSNQPLAHFGKIEIGPLDFKPARELLVQPLHALGYYFGNDPDKEDSSLPLHILSYTNYHPGLIQLFGRHLIEHLKNKYLLPVHPPLSITRADVEAVYRTKEVREALCDRFNLTLSCDSRYEAITLALILEQWDEQNGFDRQFSSRELHKMAQYWWPKAFEEEAIAQDRFTGLLDEMCSLGVLSTSSDENSYRLHSPNLVHLMGTQEQLFYRIDSLAKTPPPEKQALDSSRARLEDSREFSPLTFAQERVLNHPHSGVALIFGSNATGLANLAPALQRLLPSSPKGFQEIHIVAHGSEAIQQQLRQLVRDEQEANFLIALRELSGEPDQVIDEVIGAMQYCRQVQKRVLRVCFTIDPQTAWQWQQIPTVNRDEIEQQAITTLSLSRWDRIGVKQRLEMESWDGGEISPTDRLITKVLEVTGGWPCLVDEYVSRCKKNDPNLVVDEIKNDMSKPGNVLSSMLINQLGIYDYLPRSIINALRENRVRKLIHAGNPPVETLEAELKTQKAENIAEAIDYLKRLGTIITDPHFDLEPVIARNWYDA
ncbi:MAG: ATP-binding protein [Anaerolineaceae bacterium]|nr:ATP-binding protein [Anaerolineaceae bacterium]